uniref:Uncharacterized protein n=1 Tax=uncultured marine virus TaxID=186617 RepID=A0A0F7L4B4_9VIRU|nr:hypothetical protein [uncultured marine virus]
MIIQLERLFSTMLYLVQRQQPQPQGLIFGQFMAKQITPYIFKMGLEQNTSSIQLQHLNHLLCLM